MTVFSQKPVTLSVTHQFKPKKTSSPNLALWDSAGTVKPYKGEAFQICYPTAFVTTPYGHLTFCCYKNTGVRGRKMRGVSPHLETGCPGPTRSSQHQLGRRKGIQAEICQYFWLYRAKKDIFFYIVQNRKLSYEQHGAPQPSQPPSHSEAATYFPF